MSYIDIRSEIGTLNRVMLHRPSHEIESITPSTMAQLLFDDVPYLSNAQKEHDYFAEALRIQGVEVVYLEDYLRDVLLNDSIKAEFIKDYIEANEIFSPEVSEALLDRFSKLDIDSLIDQCISGVRKDELQVDLFRLPDLIRSEESMFWVNPLPNLYFTRDPAAAVGCGINIHYMRKRARRVETLLLTYVHKYHRLWADVPLWYNRNIPFPIEGGDVLVLSEKVIAVGYSERTSAKGIEEWSKVLLSSNLNKFEKVMVFAIPKTRAFMHLDTVFTMVDYDKFTIHPGAAGPMSVYELTLQADGELKIGYTNADLDLTLAKALDLPSVKLIKCGGGDPIISEREQWNDGSNTLAIAPGTVVVYDRNYVTNELLINNGIKLIEIPSAELSRGRGGPRCMSMPLHRNPI